MWFFLNADDGVSIVTWKTCLLLMMMWCGTFAKITVFMTFLWEMIGRPRMQIRFEINMYFIQYFIHVCLHNCIYNKIYYMYNAPVQTTIPPPPTSTSPQANQRFIGIFYKQQIKLDKYVSCFNARDNRKRLTLLFFANNPRDWNWLYLAL